MDGTAIAATVGDEIEATDLNPGARANLRRCLPVLGDAVAAWQDDGGFAAPGLMIMATTPSAAVVVHCCEDVDTSTVAWRCTPYGGPSKSTRRR